MLHSHVCWKFTYRNWQFPASSTFHARRIAMSALIAVSIPYIFPSKILVSLGFPASRIVVLPVDLSTGPSRTGISPVCNKVSNPSYQHINSSNISVSDLLTPVGVKKAGMPAPPALILSAIVPWGHNSIAISPVRYFFSKALLFPRKERINRSTCPDSTSGERPPPFAVPALFDTAVREWRLSFPLRSIAEMIVSAAHFSFEKIL